MDCDFSHDPNDVPRLIAAADGRRRPRARLPLRPRRRRRELGPARGARSRAGGSLYARLVLGVPRPRPDRRLQVLPARACWRRSTSTRSHSQGLRVPDRDDLPRAARGLPRRRDADHVRRPRGGGSKMSPRDRARGDLEGAAAPPGRARGPAVTLRLDERGHGRDVRAGGAAGGRAASSTSGRPGAARARRSSRCSSSSRPSRGRSSSSS